MTLLVAIWAGVAVTIMTKLMVVIRGIDGSLDPQAAATVVIYAALWPVSVPLTAVAHFWPAPSGRGAAWLERKRQR